jgi:hypothetical protein
MKYMMLIYGNEAASANMTEEEVHEEMREYYAFGEYAQSRATIVAEEALHPVKTATTVRVRDGKTVTTDGPFAETHEALGGFYLIDCKDLDTAIEIASQIPGARNGSVEIRPVMVFENIS